MNKLLEKLKGNNLFKNSMIIMYGQSISSFISFFSTIILIKAVELSGVGIIALVQSYSGIFNGIFNFQSYNAIIKFGSEALENNDMGKYKKYLKQALIQDLITAVLAFTFGLILINPIANFMNWDRSLVFFIKIYLITILFNITGSVNGLLRLHNEFKPGAKIAVYTAIAKIIFLVIGISSGFSLAYYIIVEIILALLNNILFFISGYKCLKKNNCLDFVKEKIHFDREFTMFNFYNNIVSTIDMPTGQLVNIIISKMLGVTEVGVYNVLIKFGGLLTKVTDPIIQALLPELSKFVAQGKNLSAYQMVKKIFTYIVSFGVVSIIGVAITYKIWLPMFMPATRENLITFILYLTYIFTTSAIAGIHLLFVSLNLVKYNLPITLGCNIVYLFILYVLALNLGLNGIILALIIQALGIVLIKHKIIKSKGYLLNEK